jgi:hypothetical protein
VGFWVFLERGDQWRHEGRASRTLIMHIYLWSDWFVALVLLTLSQHLRFWVLRGLFFVLRSRCHIPSSMYLIITLGTMRTDVWRSST